MRSNRFPSSQQESGHGFYAAAGPGRDAPSCAADQNVFKRSADALLIDIGINDVGFSSWAAGIILQDPLLRSAASAMTPCSTGLRGAPRRGTFSRGSTTGTDFCGPFLISTCCLISGSTRRM